MRAADALRHAAKRKTETEEQQEQRRREDANRHVAMREEETEEQQEQKSRCRTTCSNEGGRNFRAASRKK